MASPALDVAARQLAHEQSLEASVDLSGQLLLHYRVEEKIGEGGMGAVYRARDTHLDRFVAIKVLSSDKVADPERKRRFMLEARAASALNHPNIVTIHDISESGGVTFITMEHIDGDTLGALIRRKALRMTDTLRYGIQIADALTKAHAAGIVHRDIKPSNIMVTGDALVKVLDFGLAKLSESTGADRAAARELTENTLEGTIVGTVAYMSPEQAEGKPADSRSDIFSFGSVLYEMATGRRAFQGDRQTATLVHRKFKLPARPRFTPVRGRPALGSASDKKNSVNLPLVLGLNRILTQNDAAATRIWVHLHLPYTICASCAAPCLPESAGSSLPAFRRGSARLHSSGRWGQNRCLGLLLRCHLPTIAV